MKNHARGMTLIELMMAISVLGILLAVAIPGFRTISVQSQVTAAANDLVSTLNLARSEALRRSGNVVVCTSSDRATCTDSPWTTGWLVFADANGNEELDVPGEAVVQVWPALHGQLTLTNGALETRVSYNALGMATSATTFTVASSGCAVQRQVVITVNAAGSIRSNRTTCVVP